MRLLTALFVIGLSLLFSAYDVASCGKPYDSIVLILTLLAVLTFLVTIAIYEIEILGRDGYRFLRKLLVKNYIFYTLFTIPLAIMVTIITIILYENTYSCKNNYN